MEFREYIKDDLDNFKRTTKFQRPIDKITTLRAQHSTHDKFHSFRGGRCVQTVAAIGRHIILKILAILQQPRQENQTSIDCGFA